MSKIPNLIITAHCDKAARPNNEDNCLVRANLSQSEVQYTGDGAPFLSKEIELDKAGCLLVVADGMGGMNAGEVASRIAVDAVSNFFDTQLEGVSEKSDEEIFQMIHDAIVYADENIKFDAGENPDHSGMGTTIAILWLLNEKAYVGWCGDSRIYCYNTITRKLKRLTHDHSWVQLMVDEGDISEKDAFDHPKSNIIMRSLGDSEGEVKPETLKEPVRLCSGDVFLLCSDGLCGALPDNPGESKLPKDVNIVSVLNTAAETFPPNQLDRWNNLLWEKGEPLCHDNVTSILCHVSNCSYEPKSPALLAFQEDEDERKRVKSLVIKLLLAFLALALLVGGVVFFVKHHKDKQLPEQESQQELNEEYLQHEDSEQTFDLGTRSSRKEPSKVNNAVVKEETVKKDNTPTNTTPKKSRDEKRTEGTNYVDLE